MLSEAEFENEKWTMDDALVAQVEIVLGNWSTLN